jgi:hypothetical protein
MYVYSFEVELAGFPSFNCMSILFYGDDVLPYVTYEVCIHQVGIRVHVHLRKPGVYCVRAYIGVFMYVSIIHWCVHVCKHGVYSVVYSITSDAFICIYACGCYV